MSELPPGPPDGYVLGRSDAETRRLIAQHQLYGPFTRQFLVAAGITAGMRVLDTAAARVQAAGWSTVVLRGGDVLRLDLEGFDAVVGRWVLQYTPDPAGLLRRARDGLGPGGVVGQDGVQLLPAIVGAWAHT
jgi:SAM-dependent methyltransferase